MDTLLRQRVAEQTDPARAQDLLIEAVESLQTSLEELRVPGEELLLSRQSVETERQRFLDLFEFAPDAYLVTNPTGLVLEANHVAFQLFGAHPYDLLKKPLILYVPQEGAGAFAAS